MAGVGTRTIATNFKRDGLDVLTSQTTTQLQRACALFQQHETQAGNQLFDHLTDDVLLSDGMLEDPQAIPA